ncbi:carbon storage regulator [Bacillus coahuilensis m2-6]|uniref:carbon storage regulator CsrA n=1 Tax=Bacillus coahuilensis TaxID=408580 RepID=UPI0007501564|nr:carbon storage regulator CsrA [Bacillus coahuilensis]KUP05706.1 carbon storage regulator [Bacillus coahuilensis m2-6]
MLILSRKQGEAIQIGQDIELVVVSVQGDQVKVGVNAPKHIEIHRKEIFLEIQSSNEEATKDISDLFTILSQDKKANFFIKLLNIFKSLRY